MYETHFGFHRQPFQNADLARAFVVSESIRNILPQLLHALRTDLGVAVLTGPSGVGKTSFLKHLRSLLANEGRTIICSAASLESPRQFLSLLHSASQLRAGDKSVQEPTSDQPPRSRSAVVEQMRKSTEFWGPILLLIDDAHLLSVAVLNELRAFTEEEWNGRGLLRGLIAGPLTLEEELARPTHADFSHRIRCHSFLHPFTTKESIEFLAKHLDAVGGHLPAVFSPSALEVTASACDGLPRCLSLLADESLVIAAELSRALVDDECVRKALGRLQHLPYAWTASPLASDNESHAKSEHYAFESRPAAAPVASAPRAAASSVIEFGAPGIIEIGARSAEPASATANLIASVVASAVDRYVLASETASSRSDSSSAPPIEFENLRTSAGSFEVGHRFTPQDAEDRIISNESNEDASDFLGFVTMPDVEYQPEIDASIEIGDSADASHLLSAHGGTLNSANSDRPSHHESDIAPMSSTSENVSENAGQLSPLFEFCGLDEAESSCGTQTPDNSDHWLRDMAGEGFSNRVPVFDRYTWIALGRDVPAGSYTVSSASEMQRVSNGIVGLTSEGVKSVTLESRSPAFDAIPITQTTDQEIYSSMTRFSSSDESGTFSLFRSTHVTPQPSRDDLSVVDDLPSSAEQDAESLDVVNVEYFETRGDFTDESEPKESEVKSNDFGTSASWHDGQLIFGQLPASEDVQHETVSATPAETERVSFSFEAARVARDEILQPQIPEHHESPKETLFTLPVEIRSLARDLRSEFLDDSEVLPLAQSLAEFRSEVESFQQYGRIPADRPSNGNFESGSSETFQPASEESALVDSLLNQAKRRLDDVESMRSGRKSQLNEQGEVAILTGVVVTTSTETLSLVDEDLKLAQDSGIEAPRFSNLFTRLRQLRGGSAEK